MAETRETWTSEPAERPQRILHVLPSFTVGGIQVRLAQLVNALGPAFHHLILPLDGRADCAARLERGASWELIRMPADAWGFGPLAHLRRRACLRAARCNLVATYNWGAIEWAASLCLPFGLPVPLGARGLRHLHFEDGFGPDEAETRHRRRNMTRRLVLRRATVVVPSAALVEIARREWRLPFDAVRHIPNGIDLARFDTAARRQPPAAAERRRPEEILVGVAAPLRREKNVERLVRAAAATPETIRILVAGDGPDRRDIEAEAARLGVTHRVVFLGAVPDPAALLARLDVYALTSDTEQMPLGVLEAMAAALPVAATDVGDMRAMLAAPNHRFIVARQDEAGLTRALSRLAAEPALRREIGAANRRRAAEVYPWTRVLAAYRHLFSGGFPAAAD